MSIRVEISVVIPHYNSSEEIKRALDSAVAQSEPPLEVIVVDDNSSLEEFNNLTQILQELPHAGFSVYLLRRGTNMGPASCRNAGWAVCKGKYVAFLDADDEWHTDKLSVVSEILRSDPTLDFVSHQAIPLRDNWQTPCPPSLPKRRLKIIDLVYRNSVATPAVVVRSDVPHRFPENRRYSEDFELWLKLASNGSRMCEIQWPLVGISRNAGHKGLSSSRFLMAGGEVLSLVCGLYQRPRWWILLPFAIAWSLARSFFRVLGISPAEVRAMLGVRLGGRK